MGPADEEWLKEGVQVHECQPAVSFKIGKPGVVKDVRTPIIYMSSRMHLNEHVGFKRGDVLGDGLIFVAGLVLVEPEEFLISGEFTALHDSFSSGTLFIAWSEHEGLHVLVRNAISNL